MKNTIDKIITWLFVVVFGTVWLFTRNTCVWSSEFTISISDSNGKKQTELGLRTNFKTQEVAYSYFKEYERAYPELSFTLNLNTPKIKRSIVSKIKE